MTWQVAFHDEFVPEFRNLSTKVQDEIYSVGRLLEQFGPLLGRPQVDTLSGSRHANMKEIRFGAADGEWRVAFALRPRARSRVSGRGRQVGRQREVVLPRAHPQGRRAA